MAGHRVVRQLDVRVRTAVAHRQRRVVRQAGRNVAIQLVVCRGLVGEDVGNEIAFDERFEQLDRIRDHSDRHRLSSVARFERTFDRGVERRRGLIEVALVEPPLDS